MVLLPILTALQPMTGIEEFEYKLLVTTWHPNKFVFWIKINTSLDELKFCVVGKNVFEI